MAELIKQTARALSRSKDSQPTSSERGGLGGIGGDADLQRLSGPSAAALRGGDRRGAPTRARARLGLCLALGLPFVLHYPVAFHSAAVC